MNVMKNDKIIISYSKSKFVKMQKLSVLVFDPKNPISTNMLHNVFVSCHCQANYNSITL